MYDYQSCSFVTWIYHACPILLRLSRGCALFPGIPIILTYILFEFNRLQFPTRLRFINLSNEQTLKIAVGCSPVGSPNNLYVNVQGRKTIIIIYHEAHSWEWFVYVLQEVNWLWTVCFYYKKKTIVALEKIYISAQFSWSFVGIFLSTKWSPTECFISRLT